MPRTTATATKASKKPPLKALKPLVSKAKQLEVVRKVEKEQAKKRLKDQREAERLEHAKQREEEARRLTEAEEEENEDDENDDDGDEQRIHDDEPGLDLGLSSHAAFSTGLEGMTTLADEEEDIFEVIAERDWIKRGKGIYYEIYKDSEMLARKEHPYSWDTLQKEYGKGLYQVRLKDKAEKRIRKAQTKGLAAIPGQDGYNGYQIPQPGREAAQASAALAALDALTPAKVLEMVQAAEARVRAENASKVPVDTGTSAVMQLLMQTMQNNQQATNSMLDRQAQATNSMFERMDRNAQENTKLFQEQIKAIVNRPEKKEMGFLELLAIMDRGADKAILQQKTLMDMVKEQNEDKEDLGDRMMEAIGKLKSDAPVKDESTLDTLLRGIAPAIGPALAAIAASKGGAPVAVPVGAVPAPVAQPVFHPAASSAPLSVKSLTPTVVGNRPLAPQKGKNLVKEKILNALTPMVAQGLTLGTSAVKVAEKCCAALHDLRISRLDVITNVKEADLIELRKAYKLPVAADPWLRELYAHITEAPNTSVPANNASPAKVDAVSATAVAAEPSTPNSH